MATRPSAPAWLDVPADANALADGVWPDSAARDDDGRLVIAGVDAAELAARFGTPLYVTDEAQVRARAGRVRDAFGSAFAAVGASVAVYYAGKAFLSTEVARWVAEAGLNIDVCTGGELAVALAAGVDPARLGFHGNNKSLAEIERAVSRRRRHHRHRQPHRDRSGGGCRSPRRSRAGRAAARQQRSARAHPRVPRHRARGPEVRRPARATPPTSSPPSAIATELRFLGLHCHIGSQIFDAGGFAESAARLLAVHAELLAGGDVPELNLGGGFGIAYTAADEPTPIERIAAGMAEAVGAACASRGIPVPRIAIEPGRYIVGSAGITLYEVGTVKPVEVDGGVRTYVSVDGGMSDNARPALYGADYTVRIASRVTDAAPALVRVAGKHCESGDIVVDADYLPGDVRPGDLLAVAATGAYCWSLASNYNYLGRPAVVAVRDGAARVIVRGETEADLLARDAGIPLPTPAGTDALEGAR